MEKFVVALKEPLWRRLLRYVLWALILGCLGIFCVYAMKAATRAFAESRIKAAAGVLAELSPPQAIGMAEKIYRMEPSRKNRLTLLGALIDGREWSLADAVLDGMRPTSNQTKGDFETQACDIIVTAHVAPESLKGLTVAFKASPQNDEERLLLARAAFESNDANLKTLAHRLQRQMEGSDRKDELMLTMAQMDAREGDKVQARELCNRLLGQRLTASSALLLLKLCDSLKVDLADDYRSTLKIAARGNSATALALTRYLEETQGAQMTADWLLALPAAITQTSEIKVKIAEELFKAGKREEAIATAERMEPSNFSKMIGAVLKEERSSSAMSSAASAAELTAAVELAKNTCHYGQELDLLTALNKSSPTFWSLQEAIAAAEKSHDEKAIATAYEGLSEATQDSLLIKTQAAYWSLINNENKTDAKAAYEILKGANARYPDRSEIKATLALAHERLGNLTDALLTLPANLTTDRENLIAGYLFARAREYDKAREALTKVSEDNLSPSETELCKQASAQLEPAASTPLQQFFDALKPSK